MLSRVSKFAATKVASSASAKLGRATMATGKDVKFGQEARALMLQGVDKLADAVQVCLSSIASFSGNAKLFPIRVMCRLRSARRAATLSSINHMVPQRSPRCASVSQGCWALPTKAG
jgi:hypothetical protein